MPHADIISAAEYPTAMEHDAVRYSRPPGLMLSNMGVAVNLAPGGSARPPVCILCFRSCEDNARKRSPRL